MALVRGMIHASEVNQMLAYLAQVALHLPTAFSEEDAVEEKKRRKKKKIPGFPSGESQHM